MTWFDQDSVFRDISFYTKVILPIVIIVPSFLAVMYFGLQKPMEDHWAQVEANDKLKTQQEHDRLISMDCKTLGDWLLQDNVWNHDNLIWAQNHYSVNCK